MSPGLPVRCFSPTAQNISALVQLDQRCLGGFWTEAGYKREFESPNSIFRVLTPATDDFPVDPEINTDHTSGTITPLLIGMGCFWAILDEAHITLLGIDPDYQRRGLGQWLLLELLQAACQKQLHHATLEVRASNLAAQKLYQKFDFQCIGRRRQYYRDGEDAFLLWRSGLQSEAMRQQLQQQEADIHIRLNAAGWDTKSLSISENHP